MEIQEKEKFGQLILTSKTLGDLKETAKAVLNYIDKQVSFSRISFIIFDSKREHIKYIGKLVKENIILNKTRRKIDKSITDILKLKSPQLISPEEGFMKELFRRSFLTELTALTFKFFISIENAGSPWISIFSTL